MEGVGWVMLMNLLGMRGGLGCQFHEVRFLCLLLTLLVNRHVHVCIHECACVCMYVCLGVCMHIQTETCT